MWNVVYMNKSFFTSTFLGYSSQELYTIDRWVLIDQFTKKNFHWNDKHYSDLFRR